MFKGPRDLALPGSSCACASMGVQAPKRGETVNETSCKELGGEDLERAVGGVLLPNRAEIYNSRGQGMGYRDSDGSVRYCPCTKCGKPMHRGTLALWYCDPCDDHWRNPPLKIWSRSEGELDAASL